jgi:hypothetical protein
MAEEDEADEEEDGDEVDDSDGGNEPVDEEAETGDAESRDEAPGDPPSKP